MRPIAPRLSATTATWRKRTCSRDWELHDTYLFISRFFGQHQPRRALSFARHHEGDSDSAAIGPRKLLWNSRKTVLPHSRWISSRPRSNHAPIPHPRYRLPRMKFDTRALSPSTGLQCCRARPLEIDSTLVAGYQIHQKRRFRDYFTAVLPGSSLHPDSQLQKNGKGERSTTTVRIPLRNAKHHFGVSCARGNRPRNEDSYQAGVIDIPTFSEPATFKEEHLPGHEPNVFYFGVFDGHGGDEASIFLRDYLHQYIEESSKLFNPENKPIPLLSRSPDRTEERIKLQTELVNSWKNTVGGYFRRFKPDFGLEKRCGASGEGGIAAILTYALLRLDLDFITKSRPWFQPEDPDQTLLTSAEPTNPFKGGSTATAILISTSTPKPFWNPSQTSTLIAAHLGDTRALLCRVSDGSAIPLTTNHSPSSHSEAARLRRYAAAFVQDSFGEERFGFLANTRSVGDVGQKRLGVSAEPDLTVKPCAPGEYAFVVLVSDGITAVLGDQEIVDIVKECKTPAEAARELTEFVEEVGDVGDNATALVVRMGGWEKRNEGGEGWLGTKQLREWRREAAEERGGRGARM